MARVRPTFRQGCSYCMSSICHGGNLSVTGDARMGKVDSPWSCYYACRHSTIDEEPANASMTEKIKLNFFEGLVYSFAKYLCT